MRNYKKKIMLGTSDAWSTSHLSQQTSKPAYYIVDCRISGLLQLTRTTFWPLCSSQLPSLVRNCTVFLIELLAIDETKSGNHPWSKDFSQRSRQFSNSIKKDDKASSNCRSIHVLLTQSLSWFQILSWFYSAFILISSWFYHNFIRVLSR